jgi:hypothetical protein
MDENSESYPEGICEIGQLAQWMKNWELPQSGTKGTCTMDENWMKMDETSLFKYFRFTFANPSIIQFLYHFKMFLHKFEEDGFQNKKYKLIK